MSPYPDSYWYLHLLICNRTFSYYSNHTISSTTYLVDRFFATGTIRPSSDSVLLVSIATLHISIKIRESAIIKLSTLSWFGRGALFATSTFSCWYRYLLMQYTYGIYPLFHKPCMNLQSGKFSPSRITHTELLVLQSLDWLANPPTTISFIMHLLLLLPDNISLNSKREIFESSRFLAGMFMYDLITSIHANMN